MSQLQSAPIKPNDKCCKLCSTVLDNVTTGICIIGNERGTQWQVCANCAQTMTHNYENWTILLQAKLVNSQ